MTTFSTIKITQYKNYNLTQFDFNERIVGICGLNGKGKTNLLDAIYYLCFAKSYFNKIKPSALVIFETEIWPFTSI